MFQASNGGLVMVNFYPIFISCNETASITNVAGKKNNCAQTAKTPDANFNPFDSTEHINHIRAVAGVDHVGLGAGFDGIN